MLKTEYEELKRKIIEDKDKSDKLEGIDVADKPESTKLGYILIPYVLDATHIAWKYEKDPNFKPSNSYTHPIEWFEGMDVLAGVNPDYISDGWYIYNGLTQRCIKDGNPTSFTDKTYWEIIN